MAGVKGRPKVQPDGTFGWEELERLVDPDRVRKAMAQHFGEAMERMGQLFVSTARDVILDEKPFASNAPLTVALKGSSTPLVDDGDLVGSLTYDVVSWKKLRMGVNSRRLSSGRLLAEVLHEGATIRVTPRIRAAVMAKLREKAGDKRFRALAQGFGAAKSVWVIPPRPFLTRTFADPDFVKRSADWMLEALDASLTLER